MKVLLLYPNSVALAGDFHASLLPVGLPVLAALLKREGFDTVVANLPELDSGNAEAILRSHRPSLVGISQFTHNRHEAVRLAEMARRVLPPAVILLGGPHASFCAEELLQRFLFVDGVVVGEGEWTLLEVAHAVSEGRPLDVGISGLALRLPGRVVTVRQRKPLTDLDTLPFAAEGFPGSIGVDPRKQGEFIVTSRGCPARCIFCSSPSFWQGRLRFRSASSMLAELEHLRDQYGLIYFSIRDDTFTADRRRVMEFCQGLMDRQMSILWNCQSRVSAVDREMLLAMRRAGCECIQFGLESGSPRILQKLGKGIEVEQTLNACRLVREVGINLSVYLISAIPGETDTDFAQTLELLGKIRPHDLQVSPLAYYPGTRLFADAVQSGKVAADLFFSSQEPGVTVAWNRLGKSRHQRLEKTGGQIAVSSSYKGADYSSHRAVVGYCHAGNLMAGEYFEAEGDAGRAEELYGEICRRQPGNPWGWLALGEMLGSQGRFGEGSRALQKVLELIPRHAPAYTMLGEIASWNGQRKLARTYFEAALSLDPHDRTAAEGLASL